MKKAIVFTLCLALAGLLAVNGTFAAEFTQAVSEAVSSLFQTVTELLTYAEPTTNPEMFDVYLTYLDGNGANLPLLSPGVTVEREAAVHNASNESNAYFCIAIAVQAEAADVLTLHVNQTGDYAWSDWRDIKLDGADYKMKLGIYQKALPAGADSSPALLRVALDKDVTSADLAKLTDQCLQIQVLAINADDFIIDGVQLSAGEALQKALPIDSADFNPFE